MAQEKEGEEMIVLLIVAGYIMCMGISIALIDGEHLNDAPYLPFIWPVVLLLVIGGAIGQFVKKLFTRNEKK